MNITSLLSRRRLAVLLMLLVSVASFSALAFVLSASSDPSVSTPSDVDLANVKSLISTWQESCLEGWPKDEMKATDLSAEAASAIDRAYSSLKQEVGTDEWVEGKGPNLYPSLAGQMEGMRQESPETAYTGYQAKVLAVKFVRFAKDGDAVFYASVWECHSGYDLAQTAAAKDVPWEYDQTPVYGYELRKLDGKANDWRLVCCWVVEDSEDLDPGQSGPDTPHRNFPYGQDG